MKCGIGYRDEEDDYDGHEHMWFEPVSWNGDQFEGRLINHPFYVKTMQEGEVYPLTRDDITDWTIYYQDGNYTRIPFINYCLGLKCIKSLLSCTRII